MSKEVKKPAIPPITKPKVPPTAGKTLIPPKLNQNPALGKIGKSGKTSSNSLVINSPSISNPTPIAAQTGKTNQKLVIINPLATVSQNQTNSTSPSSSKSSSPSSIVNPSLGARATSQQKSSPSRTRVVNPSVPARLLFLRNNETKKTENNSNSSINNPVFSMIANSSDNLKPKEERQVLGEVIDEKTDSDIQELLKGHKNIVEENLNLKKERKKKKTLKNFLSPLQIATYNTYNPTPESLEKLFHSKQKVISPQPIHHNSQHPANFSNNAYQKNVKQQQLSIGNTLETAKLLRIVENELSSARLNRNLEKKKSSPKRKKMSSRKKKNSDRVSLKKIKQKLKSERSSASKEEPSKN